jgi:hypothetical protein
MGEDNQRYGTVNPGIGIAAGQWFWRRIWQIESVLRVRAHL